MCCSRWGRLLPMLLPMHHCLSPQGGGGIAPQYPSGGPLNICLAMRRPVVQAVISQLEVMMGQGSAFILPSIEALANLCLSPDQQARRRLALRQQQQQIPAASSAGRTALRMLPTCRCACVCRSCPCACRPGWWMLCWIASNPRMQRICRQWRASSCSMPPQAAS